MRVAVRIILITLLSLSIPAMAGEPLYEDDNENFALLEEQAQAAEEQPVAQETDSYELSEFEEASDNHRSRQSYHNNDNTARNIDLVNTVQSLLKEFQELRGQLELQAHELDKLKQKILAYDLSGTDQSEKNEELKNTDTQSAATPELSKNDAAFTGQSEPELKSVQTITHAASTKRVNPADEQISYLAAYELVKQQKFSRAIEEMKQFLNKYPNGGYSANAHYWLGDMYLSEKNYAQAIIHFKNILQNFKSSNQYAASQLKLGFALAESGHVAEAKTLLTSVINLYPDTSTAYLAHTKLEQLGG